MDTVGLLASVDRTMTGFVTRRSNTAEETLRSLMLSRPDNCFCLWEI